MIKKLGLRRRKYFFLNTSYVIGYLTVAILWLLGVFLIPFVEDNIQDWLRGYSIILPFNLVFFIILLHYLVRYYCKKDTSTTLFLKVFFFSLLSVLPVIGISYFITSDEDAPIFIGISNFTFGMVITLPLAAFILRKFHERKEELRVIKEDLINKNARLQLLTWQINPHFLYNALNTLYASALKDGSHTTGEGIIELAGMMRYFLDGNSRNKITIEEEVKYLQSYINLQKFNLEANNQVLINLDLTIKDDQKEISPMLLLPFIENAFKHGLSFQRFSPIDINLKVNSDSLYLYVYNKKHPERKKDLSGYEGGIGLENVKQRLQILFPESHKLTIRNEQEEYKITLQLKLD